MRKVLANILFTIKLEANHLFNPDIVEEFVTNAIYSTYHPVNKFMPDWVNYKWTHYLTYLILLFGMILNNVDCSKYTTKPNTKRPLNKSMTLV